MFDGLILKGTATKASLRTYRILKLQTTLPCLENNNISFRCSLLTLILQKISFVFVNEGMVFVSYSQKNCSGDQKQFLKFEAEGR